MTEVIGNSGAGVAAGGKQAPIAVCRCVGPGQGRERAGLQCSTRLRDMRGQALTLNLAMAVTKKSHTPRGAGGSREHGPVMRHGRAVDSCAPGLCDSTIANFYLFEIRSLIRFTPNYRHKLNYNYATQKINLYNKYQ